jgi:uncharacterized protein (TIGR02118 family)
VIVMVKAMVLYGHPKSAEDFEKYYAGPHAVIAAKMPEVARLELTLFLPGPDGTKPPFYRMAELYYATPAQMHHSLGSPEGTAVIEDLPKFATGGFTLMTGSVEE